MSAEKWPVPKKDTTDFLFLYPFYDRGRKIVAESPQHALHANRLRANNLAVRLVNLLQIYDEFPPLELSDPCGIHRSLPVQLSGDRDRWITEKHYVNVQAVLNSTAKVPSSTTLLGDLEIWTRRRESYISKIVLSQPGECQSLRLGNYPEDRESDCYPSNAQAMNFIGMTEDYLDQFEKTRLVIVRN